jgi:hypothetical protein
MDLRGEERTMKPINQKARKVMDTLTIGIDKPGDHRKIDNAKGAFMPVHVECIGRCNYGLLYSIAHYYEQNGDLMRDPEMVFIKGADNRYYPTYFRQDGGLGFEQEAVIMEDEKVKAFKPPIQDELKEFANGWMQNIKEQQAI